MTLRIEPGKLPTGEGAPPPIGRIIHAVAGLDVGAGPGGEVGVVRRGRRVDVEILRNIFWGAGHIELAREAPHCQSSSLIPSPPR